MEVLETAVAVIPDTNKNAPGKSIYREIVYSGFSIDNRELTSDDIKEMYFNTKSFMLDKGSLVKVKVSHWQEMAGEELKGFVTGLELRKDTDEKDEEKSKYSIWAKMHLYEEVYEQYTEGRYPEVSIYSMDEVRDKEGNKYRNVIEHIALLGSTRAALPELETGKFDMMFKAFSTMIDKMKSILPLKKGEHREMEIKTEDIDALIEMVEGVKTTLASWKDEEQEDEDGTEGGEGEGNDSGERKATPPANNVQPPANNEGGQSSNNSDAAGQQRSANLDIEKKIAEMNKQMAEIEYERMFAANAIIPDQKENFMKICTENGVEFARSVYDKREIPKPPEGDQYSAGSGNNAELEEARKRLTEQGLIDKPIGQRMIEDLEKRKN
jgi:hypothetical protein